MTALSSGGRFNYAVCTLLGWTCLILASCERTDLMAGAVQSERWRDGEKKCLQEMMAAGLKAYPVPGSGSGTRKGDIRTGDLLVEQKTTDAASFSLSDDTLEKIDIEAYQSGSRRGIMRITLGSDKAFYVVPADLMVEWLEHLAEDDIVT